MTHLRRPQTESERKEIAAERERRRRTHKPQMINVPPLEELLEWAWAVHAKRQVREAAK